MSERFAVVALSDMAVDQASGQPQWHTVRRSLGVQAFGINAWTATKDDGQIIGEHDEAGGERHEEVYVVVRGHARFTLDGEEVDAPQGTIVHVSDPAVKRAATGKRDTTILVVGAKPGEAFTPSSWERSAEALRFWPTEEWDEAIEVLERHLAETPDHAGTHYNLACAHARAGRPEVAVGYLKRSVELDPRFAGYAQTDDDLAPLREHPAFPQPEEE